MEFFFFFFFFLILLLELLYCCFAFLFYICSVTTAMGHGCPFNFCFLGIFERSLYSLGRASFYKVVRDIDYDN